MTIKPSIDITYVVHLSLNEEQATALVELLSYDMDSFLTKFYGSFGSYYVKPYEKGLRSLQAQVRTDIPNQLKVIKDAREKIKTALSK